MNSLKLQSHLVVLLLKRALATQSEQGEVRATGLRQQAQQKQR
jgi:hypothetical protein